MGSFWLWLRRPNRLVWGVILLALAYFMTRILPESQYKFALIPLIPGLFFLYQSIIKGKYY
ncbi:MAG: hypothetical protein A2864_02555 [Candidatus Woykebacteria bacterium RIFCSPHIGHO2_01_FULL_39_12]|uniref:Uncharacterized protein n=2 Tax=Candidatus Woykeibacteriota TaxID=1817899 RepID=A0A1G1WE23_9BACT|nr:MAG: hypothetical protein A2134_02710 [Candidatus Woykebacteria bacterium RBG_16_39_9b]OGY27901.1 MAG: hypothetical protein A2864_02555 [Candidatus Woykebacteria bacterium RIFCSPHIGHO2_01_FULL_39_12]